MRRWFDLLTCVAILGTFAAIILQRPAPASEAPPAAPAEPVPIPTYELDGVDGPLIRVADVQAYLDWWGPQRLDAFTARLDAMDAKLALLPAIDTQLNALAAALYPGPESDGVPLTLRVNINTADEAELKKLPGIGPTLAARIRTYIDAAGPVESLDPLVGNVRGFGMGKAAQIAPYIIFSDPPVSEQP